MVMMRRRGRSGGGGDGMRYCNIGKKENECKKVRKEDDIIANRLAVCLCVD